MDDKKINKIRDFKKGDSVVLIDDDDIGGINVVLYNTYIVDSYVSENIMLEKFTPLIVLVGVDAALAGERFISLLDFRKQKINKILDKYNGT